MLIRDCRWMGSSTNGENDLNGKPCSLDVDWCEMLMDLGA